MNKIITLIFVLAAPLGYSNEDLPKGLYKSIQNTSSVDISVCLIKNLIILEYTKFSGQKFMFEASDKDVVIIEDLKVIDFTKNNLKSLKIAYTYSSQYEVVIGSLFIYDGFQTINVLPFKMEKISDNCSG
ncbi:hypothetical protein ACFOND_07010 [Reinekea marina]|uniref:Uncharacterized protein n=1 Tax=Reinekea marina TaxID=1310421 RepID=A0ABV7WSW1_9GAMM